jgi:hypothetical protein
MLGYRKLWDFMEEIPEETDPRKLVEQLVFDAIENAK